MSLGRGVAIRIESPGLVAIRRELVDAFAGMLTRRMRADGPHVTIQNKVTPATAKLLLQQMERDFRPRAVELIGLGLVVSRRPMGNAFASFVRLTPENPCL